MRGVAKTTLRLTPRRVSDTPSSALAAKRCRDAGHDLEFDASGGQRVDLLLRAAEDHRIAAFEPHHGLVPLRGFAPARD